MDSVAPPKPNIPTKSHPINKRLLLKYIHNNFSDFPKFHTGDNLDAKQQRGKHIFIPEDLNNLLLFWKFRDYSDITEVSQNRNNNIIGQPSPTLGYFSNIPKNPKGETIDLPTKYL